MKFVKLLALALCASLTAVPVCSADENVEELLQPQVYDLGETPKPPPVRIKKQTPPPKPAPKPGGRKIYGNTLRRLLHHLATRPPPQPASHRHHVLKWEMTVTSSRVTTTSSSATAWKDIPGSMLNWPKW
jgi:hypothetical protein